MNKFRAAVLNSFHSTILALSLRILNVSLEILIVFSFFAYRFSAGLARYFRKHETNVLVLYYGIELSFWTIRTSCMSRREACAAQAEIIIDDKEFMSVNLKTVTFKFANMLLEIAFCHRFSQMRSDLYLFKQLISKTMEAWLTMRGSPICIYGMRLNKMCNCTYHRILAQPLRQWWHLLSRIRTHFH